MIRHDDRRRLGGLTWIGWANVLVFQWFGVRLVARCDDETGVHLGYDWWLGVWPLAKWDARAQSYSIVWALWVTAIVVQAALG